MSLLGNDADWRHEAPIGRLEVNAYTIPTDSPESDGTLEWDRTTIVVVRASAGGKAGIGYTYADKATATLIKSKLADIVEGQSAFATGFNWISMVRAIRNLGRPGIASMAISAVDAALWDLKARLMDLPLVTLLGQTRAQVEIYGSGGFTSYTPDQLRRQLSAWVEQGIPRVKMKVGREPEKDIERVRTARDAIGADARLFVDANGAYGRKQALAAAEHFVEFGVSWFEEPVSSDDLDGLRLIRNQGPGGMEVAAGEYGYDPTYFRRMIAANAVDVLQADGTRCAGITGFMQAAALCEGWSMPLSAHCAPSQHVHPCCAAVPVRHIEYFHDHVRIEHMLFDGVLTPVEGCLRPDLSRAGNGLELKRADAARFEA